MRRRFCCSIALPRTPASHSQTMREFLQSWETVSLQKQRLPAVSDPGVPEFFLLSDWNLPSCNFHPLFPVTCLQPEKKQALFSVVTALSREAERVCGQTESCPLWPSVSSSVKCCYQTWPTEWLGRFEKMCIGHTAAGSVTDYHCCYYGRCLRNFPAGLVVKTSRSSSRDVGLILGGEVKIPCASLPKKKTKT